MIDRSWVHVWKPMLHTFAVGTWNIYEQQVQYVAHARARYFEYVPGRLEAQRYFWWFPVRHPLGLGRIWIIQGEKSYSFGLLRALR